MSNIVVCIGALLASCGVVPLLRQNCSTSAPPKVTKGGFSGIIGRERVKGERVTPLHPLTLIRNGMKVGIIGAGAIGSLLGFYLCEQAEVWLLSRQPAHIEAISTQGLRCERDGAEETRHPHITSDSAAIGRCDVVLVLVKAYQT